MSYNEKKLAEALHLLIERDEQIARMKEEIRELQAEREKAQAAGDEVIRLRAMLYDLREAMKETP